MNNSIRVSDKATGYPTIESATAQLRFRKQSDGRMLLEQRWTLRTPTSLSDEWRLVPIVEAEAEEVE